MRDPKIEVSVAMEADEDWPVADVLYDGDHWASATLRDGRLLLTVYGQSKGKGPIPLDSAIEALTYTRRRLDEILGGRQGNVT